MRAVKCPVSDVTASTASSQGQHKEDPLIYSQSYRNPSATCRQDSAFHLQTTGNMDKLFPISYPCVLVPFITSHLVLLWVCLSVCLSVLLRLSVGFAISYSVPPLSHTQTHTVNTLFPPSLFSLTNTSEHTYALNTNTRLLQLFPLTLISRSDNTGRLIYELLVNMINSSSIWFSVQAWCLF